jgi:hypothetical protein
VQKNWVPFGTKDFGPYIPGIKSDIDAIFSLMVGPMALQTLTATEPITSHMQSVAFAEGETVTYLRGERDWIVVSGTKGDAVAGGLMSYVFTKLVNRGYSRLSREGYDPVTSGIEEWIGANKRIPRKMVGNGTDI